MNAAQHIWNRMDARAKDGVCKNIYHYNAMITVCEKTKKDRKALALLEEMTEKKVQKNEVTFSSAISACEKNRNYNMALELLKRMEDEGVPRTVIAYNVASSACEKGLKSGLAMEIFAKMKGEKGVVPTVITYSALISAVSLYLMSYNLYLYLCLYLCLCAVALSQYTILLSLPTLQPFLDHSLFPFIFIYSARSADSGN